MQSMLEAGLDLDKIMGATESDLAVESSNPTVSKDSFHRGRAVSSLSDRSEDLRSITSPSQNQPKLSGVSQSSTASHEEHEERLTRAEDRETGVVALGVWLTYPRVLGVASSCGILIFLAGVCFGVCGLISRLLQGRVDSMCLPLGC